MLISGLSVRVTFKAVRSRISLQAHPLLFSSRRYSPRGTYLVDRRKIAEMLYAVTASFRHTALLAQVSCSTVSWYMSRTPHTTYSAFWASRRKRSNSVHKIVSQSIQSTPYVLSETFLTNQQDV